MKRKARRPTGHGFGDGATNVTDYLDLAEQAREEERQAGERIVRVRVDRIRPSPYQARIDFDLTELDALAAAIKAKGLDQAITLRRMMDGRYELAAGERRWRAARLAGMETVEARVRDVDDFEAHLIGVSENNQRADLSPWEKSMEALKLSDHAKAAGRPCSQRKLAQYLNRNVATVNQQLAIAKAITPALRTQVGVNRPDLCRLTHEVLYRIARLPPAQRRSALAEATRASRDRAASARPSQKAEDKPALSEEPADPWRRFWERGGLQVNIRKPVRTIHPARAQRYIEGLLPGLAALATRVAETRDETGIAHWEHERGRLLFLRPAGQLTVSERKAARLALKRMIEDLGPE